ncbi:MAG: hypothetical protein KAR24_00445 [Candidatus Pacebacteria bacterium]|nr:hypothetical protein [Candidatus Paceibacterota bacterium]MCK5591150.1 hypothetical protein [Candidatus Paceibacterota bacterium]
MKKIALLSAASVFSLLLVVPLVAFGAADFGPIENLVTGVGGIVTLLPPIIIGIAVVYFLWGVVKFVGAGDDEEKRGSAKQIITYGLIGIMVMVALWGIIDVLMSILGLDDGGGAPDINLLD